MRSRTLFILLLLVGMTIGPLSAFTKEPSESLRALDKNQAIEILIFEVNPNIADLFIQWDHEIWTSYLAEQPGFLSKEVWLDKADHSTIIIIINWESLEDWQAVPINELEIVEEQFQQAVGADQYERTDTLSLDHSFFKILEYK